MKIKANVTFTAYDGQMRVFNAGDEGELPDAIASGFIDAGMAEAVGASTKRASTKRAALETSVAEETGDAAVTEADEAPVN